MAELELKCLGPLELIRGGTPLTGLRTEKGRALVCYLAVSGQVHHRAELAGTFWSDLPEEDAKNNLRVTLSRLRPFLAEHLLITRETVAFDFASPYTLDVQTFLDAFEDDHDELDRLKEAVDLYRGDFLTGIELQDASIFAEWLAAQRERFRQLALSALHTLTDASIKEHDFVSATVYLSRLLVLDPWREEGHRQLMLVYALQGKKGAALAQYAACCRVLAEELGLEPTEETIGLYEQVRRGELGPKENKSSVPVSRHVAERRHVTILVAELLVDPLLDPEDLSDQVGTFRDAWSAAVKRFAGFSPDSQGMIQTAYFGFPTAHEDDPRRATLAALQLLAQTNELGSPQRVRLAVHSGAMVVTSRDQVVDVVGLPLLVAQRLCGAGHPGSVLISGMLGDLIQGYFVLGEEIPYELEGMTNPVVARQVLGETGARSRLEVAPPKALMVGRQAELSVLQRTYVEVEASAGQVVLVLGDAGLGKSRLVIDFMNSLQSTPHHWTSVQGVSYYSSTPYYPIAAWLEREVGFNSWMDADEKLGKLRSYLVGMGLYVDEVLSSLATLLLLPYRHEPALTPERLRQETLGALVSIFLAKANRSPLVLVFEDVHWYDASTLEVLQLLADELDTTRVMMVLTSRTEPDWQTAAPQEIRRVQLESLNAADTLELIDTLAEGNELSLKARGDLAALSDGIPLYVEELLRMSHQKRFETSNVPLTLQDALTARLDQSGDAKNVAQFASVLGKTFSFELLAAASPFSESEVRRALDCLMTTGLILADEHPSTYTFKHALVQEAAYTTTLRRQRQSFHEQIARTLERNINISPELLAHHYSGAFLYAEAVQAWQQASESAFVRFAYSEAIQHLEAALALLTHLPRTPAEIDLELSLVLKLAGALHVTQGYASPNVKGAYDRAWELCSSADLNRYLFPILLGQTGYHFMRAEFAAAEGLLQRLFALPPERLIPQQLGELEFMAGRVHAFQGRLVRAQRHFTAVLAQQNDVRVQLVLSDVTSLTDIQVTSLGQSASVLWFLGYPDRALGFALQAVARDRENTNLHRRASSISFGLLVRFMRGEWIEAKKLLDDYLHLVSDQITTSWRASAKVWQGAFAVSAGFPEGLAYIQEGLALFDALGIVTQRPFLLWFYASSLKRLGQNERAFEMVDAALRQCQATGEVWWEAELLRLKGELLEQSGSTAQAAACFYQGIAVAHAQQARSLELRSWCNLVDLHRRSGGYPDSEQEMPALLRWFTEGSKTHDLRRAKVLVRGVGANPDLQNAWGYSDC